MNLKDYIGKEAKIFAPVVIKKKKVKKQKSQWTPEAKHLYRLYLHAKSPAFPISLTNNYRIVSVFNKVAERLKEHERETKAVVDPSSYIRAHFKWYQQMFPSRLLSKCSWFIYYADHAQSDIPILHIANHQQVQDFKLLKFIALQRKESAQKVFKQLKQSGLFSKQFLKIMEK